MNKQKTSIYLILFLFLISNILILVSCNNTSGWFFSNGELVISYDSLKTETFKNEKPPWYNIRNKITKITFENNVIGIPSWSFEGCNNLKSIIISKNIEFIGTKAFANCKALEKIELPENIQFCSDTFLNTKWYTTQKKGILYLDKYVIGYKGNVGKELIIKSGSTHIIENAFEELDTVTKVKIPDNVKSVGAFSFYSCKNLKEVEIGKNVKSIDYYAFYGTKLQKITIKSKDIKIDKDAFGDYTNMDSILSKHCIIYCYKDSTVYKYALKHHIVIQELK